MSVPASVTPSPPAEQTTAREDRGKLPRFRSENYALILGVLDWKKF